MSKAQTPSQPYVDAFAELAAHTAPKCGTCRVAFNCCSAGQCEITRNFAKESFGIELEDAPGSTNLPFVGSTGGCIVPPHLRPSCAVHVCGQHLKDDAWSEKYWELREIAGDALDDEVEL